MLNWILKRIHQPVYARRLAVLADKIVSQLEPNDSVLDIGCGSGLLGQAILKHERCPRDLTYKGLEKFKRGGEPIEVIEHKNGPLPFSDRAFDVVILADVLHHEEHEEFLLDEATRVCRRLLVLKDHKPDGFLALWRISFLDWAANNPYEVKCLYRYHARKEWHAMFEARNLVVVAEEDSIDLYPPLFNFVFGRRLQYLAVLKRGDGAARA